MLCSCDRKVMDMDVARTGGYRSISGMNFGRVIWDSGC